MVDLFTTDDLEGSVKPEMVKCANRFCYNFNKCRRAVGLYNDTPDDNSAIDFLRFLGATCQAYYPKYYEKDKPMSLQHEPLPDRQIAGKKWGMYLERIGRHLICHAFIEDPKVQHSFGCAGTREEAIDGCVAQIERIYTKPVKQVDLGS